jgi:hypothetical protein
MNTTMLHQAPVKILPTKFVQSELVIAEKLNQSDQIQPTGSKQQGQAVLLTRAPTLIDSIAPPFLHCQAANSVHGERKKNSKTESECERKSKNRIPMNKAVSLAEMQFVDVSIVDEDNAASV